MHDFLQTLSFQAPNSPAAARTAAEVLRSVMRSFDSDVPFTAYRPVPGARPAARRAGATRLARSRLKPRA